MGGCFSCCCCCGNQDEGDHETCCDCCGETCQCCTTCCGGCCTICKNCTEMGVETAKTAEHLSEGAENVSNMPANLAYSAANGVATGVAVAGFQVKSFSTTPLKPALVPKALEFHLVSTCRCIGSGTHGRRSATCALRQ